MELIAHVDFVQFSIYQLFTKTQELIYEDLFNQALK